MEQTTNPQSNPDRTLTYTESGAINSLSRNVSDFITAHPEFADIIKNGNLAVIIDTYLSETREGVDENGLKSGLESIDDPNVKALKDQLIKTLIEYKKTTNPGPAQARNLSGSSGQTDPHTGSPGSGVTGNAQPGNPTQSPERGTGVAAEAANTVQIDPTTALVLEGVYGFVQAFANINKPVGPFDVTDFNRDASRRKTWSNQEALKSDTKAFTTQVASMLGGDVGAQATAESFAWIPQLLAYMENPQMQAMLETIYPGASNTYKSVLNFFTGGKGSALELNKVLNTGRFGDAATRDVLRAVDMFREETTAKEAYSPKYTIGQVTKTADFLKKTYGWNFEVDAGLDEKTYESAFDTFVNNGNTFNPDDPDADYSNEMETLRQIYKARVPESKYKEDEFRQAVINKDKMFIDAQAEKALESVTGALQQQITGPGTKFSNAVNRLRNTTLDMRVAGKAFNSIATKEERQALLQKANNSVMDAENLAGQYAISLYGSSALKYGSIARANEEATYIASAVARANMDNQTFQNQAAAITKAFGPGRGELANTAVATSAVVQAALAASNTSVTDEMRLEISQRATDAISDPSFNRLAWLLEQDLTGSDDKQLKRIQEKLKNKETLDAKELKRVSTWIQEPSQFLDEMHKATGIAESKIASATSAEYSESYARTQTSTGRKASLGTTLLQARTKLDNKLTYTRGAVRSAIQNTTFSDQELERFGYTGDNKEASFISDYQLLGRLGLDPVALFSGRRELTEEEIKRIESRKGGEQLVKRLKEQRNTFVQKRDAAIQAAADEGKTLTVDMAEEDTFTEMSGGNLLRTHKHLTGLEYNPITQVLSDTEALDIAKQQTVLEKDTDRAAQEASMDTPESVLDAGAKEGSVSGAATASVRGATVPHPQGAEAAKAEREATVQAWGESQAGQTLNAVVTTFKSALTSCAKILESAASKLNNVSGSSGTQKPQTSNQPTGEQNTSRNTPAELEDAAPEVTPVVQPATEVESPAGVEGVAQNTEQEQENRFILARVDSNAATELGKQLAESIVTLVTQQYNS